MSELNEWKAPAEPTLVSRQDFLRRTFLQLAAGLTATAGVAWLGYASLISGGIVYQAFAAFPYIGILLFGSQLAAVIVLSARITKLRPVTVTALYYGYAVLTGVTFSSLPLYYGVGNVGVAFGFAALLFGSLAVIGYTTKADLTKYQTVLYAGLGILVLATFVGIFIDLSFLEMAVCYAGIGIFMGLTAYDVQKLRQYWLAYGNDAAMAAKLSTYGALQLYLDFINLFLYILRLLGLGRSRK